MSTDLDAMRERVPYLGWWLEGQAGPTPGPVVFIWYATEDKGSGLFEVSTHASGLALARPQQWNEAKRLGLAAARGKIFLNSWQNGESHTLELPVEENPITTAEIRNAILEGLYRLYEAGFDESDITVDIDGVAVELRTSAKLVQRAIKYLYDNGLIEDFGTMGRNWSTGDIWLSTSGVDHFESVLQQGNQAILAQDIGVTSPGDETSAWDVFICHASEDKDEVARPLANALSERGLAIWYDEFSLSLGDSLRRSIDRGIAGSRYGIVILSPNFFAKEWPQIELDGLVTREVRSGKTILPVWHGVSKSDIERYSPSLADKVGVPTSKGLDVVVREILRVLRSG